MVQQRKSPSEAKHERKIEIACGRLKNVHTICISVVNPYCTSKLTDSSNDKGNVLILKRLITVCISEVHRSRCIIRLLPLKLLYPLKQSNPYMWTGAYVQALLVFAHVVSEDEVACFSSPTTFSQCLRTFAHWSFAITVKSCWVYRRCF